MNTIYLNNGVWKYDPNHLLGPRGGFGAVFAGYSEKYGEVAVKEISQKAHREIHIADELLNKQFQHVIPIYDFGLDKASGKNFLVMAIAQKSLQDEIKAVQKMEVEDAVSIVLQIITGLLEVPSVIHRDLKPGNVLFHSGVWKIADFGIAKFVEESTSLETLKGFLSPEYAAPEQWNFEHPTNAVDIYALGCLAFTMIIGSPPFSGSIEDLKEQHLHHQPPISKISNPQLQTIIGSMMRKNPENRPKLDRIKTQLELLLTNGENKPSGVLQALSEAAARIADESAKKEAQVLTAKSIERRRKNIAHEAQVIMLQIVYSLFQRIQNQAPNAVISPSSKVNENFVSDFLYSIFLGNAELSFDFTKFTYIPEKAFSQSGWDVLTGVIAKISQKEREPYVWSANLWYTNLGNDKEYRWWEVSYMTSPFIRSRQIWQPYAEENIANADLAAGPGMAHIQFGSKPKTIDDEYLDNFCNRWIELFAKALKGNLQNPSRLPID